MTISALSATSGLIATPAPAPSVAATSQPVSTDGQAVTTITNSSAAPTTSAPTAFSQNQSQFEDLVSIINDTSGKYSQNDQLTAMNSLQALGATGGLIGMDKSSADYTAYNNALLNSPIAQVSSQIGNQYGAMLDAAWNSGKRGSDFANTVANFYNGLSNFNQNVLFTTIVNRTGTDGSKQFSSASDWLSSLGASAPATPSVTVTLSAAAQAALSSPSAKTGTEASATTAKNSVDQSSTSKTSNSADIALTLLQNAITSDASTKAKGSLGGAQKPYAVGDNVQATV
jgi:hypothetical protein